MQAHHLNIYGNTCTLNIPNPDARNPEIAKIWTFCHPDFGHISSFKIWMGPFVPNPDYFCGITLRNGFPSSFRTNWHLDFGQLSKSGHTGIQATTMYPKSGFRTLTVCYL